MYEIITNDKVFNNNLIPNDQTQISIKCNTIQFIEQLPPHITHLNITAIKILDKKPSTLQEICVNTLKNQNEIIFWHGRFVNYNTIIKKNTLQELCIKASDNFFPWKKIKPSLHKFFNKKILPENLQELMIRANKIPNWLVQEIISSETISKHYLFIPGLKMTLPKNVTVYDFSTDYIKRDIDYLKIKQLNNSEYYKVHKFKNIEIINAGFSIRNQSYIFNKLVKCDYSIFILDSDFYFSFPLIKKLRLVLFNFHKIEIAVKNLQSSINNCTSLEKLELVNNNNAICLKLTGTMKIEIEGNIKIVESPNCEVTYVKTHKFERPVISGGGILIDTSKLRMPSIVTMSRTDRTPRKVHASSDIIYVENLLDPLLSSFMKSMFRLQATNPIKHEKLLLMISELVKN